MAEHAEGSTDVYATPAEVLAVGADFEAYPDGGAGLEEVGVLARDRGGGGTRVAFRLRTPLGEQAYTLAYRYQPRDAGVSWTYVEGTLRDLAGAYTLEPAADGATRVTYRLEVDLGVPLPGLVRRQAAKQVVRTPPRALQRRA